MSNPYEPAGDRAAPPPLSSEAGEWSVGEALRMGWFGLTSQPAIVLGSLVPLYLFLMVVVFVPMAIVVFGMDISPLSRDFGPTFQLVSVPASLVSMLISPYLEVGWTRVYLAVARNEQPSFGLVFSGADAWARMLGLRVLLGWPIIGIQAFQAALMYNEYPTWPATLALYTVLAALGLASMLGLIFASAFVVDRGLGPLQALIASWDATAGQRGRVFLFCLACIGVIVAAECLCFLPLLAAVPVTYLAGAWIYTRLPERPLP